MSSPPIPWKHVRNILVLFAPVWIGATCLFGLIGVVTAILSEDKWAAHQPLILRDEATGAVDRLGRFASQTDLKTAQETILDITQNPEVVAAALREIGPPDDAEPEAETWPSQKIIEQVSKESVNVIAPQGSEFGDTELIYLKVTEESPQRAVAFCKAMLDSLSAHLRTVRRLRADGVVVELTYARDLARQKLNAAIAKMQEIEISIGEDLGELRNLNDTISGSGANRRTSEEISRELQTAELELERLQALHRLLVMGADDPSKLLVSGDDLLKSQPTLLRLKEGLIEAQLQSSHYASLLTAQHPRRRAAMQAEVEIAERMLQETRAAIRAMQPSLELAQGRVDRLRKRKTELDQKMARLASVRSSYSKLNSEVDALTTQLAQAEAALSEAQAGRSAALATNLLSELGPPQVGDSPEGVSGTMLTLGSTCAGLIFGLGAVFLVAPGPEGPRYGRRWGDYITGRRRTDRPGGMIPVPPGSPTPVGGTNDSADDPGPPGGVERRARG